MQIRVQDRVALCRKAIGETEPENLRALPLSDLQSHYTILSKNLRYVENGRLEIQCQDRMKLLQKEIDERHHQEVHGVAKKTYFWALVAGVTGIALVLLEVWPPIHDIFFSKPRPASAPLSPLSPPQTQPTSTESPQSKFDSMNSTLSTEPTATPILTTPEP
jgi:hypothetical protein